MVLSSQLNCTSFIIFVYYKYTSVQKRVKCLQDQINCQLSIVNCQLSILIIDIYGRQVEEIAVPKGQEEFQINLSSYPQGIYIAVLRDDKGVIGRKKFVVARP